MKQKWFRIFWVCELVVQTSSYIGSKWGCWLNQHFLKVQLTKMVQLLGYVGSNGGVGWTSIWRWLSQHFLKVQPTKMVQPSGNVGSKCWCWFNCQVMLVQNGGVGSTSIWKLLNQHILKVQPTPEFWTNKTWWLNLHKMMVEPDKC